MALLMAGCASGAGTDGVGPAGFSEDSADLAAVEGLVVDDAFAPVAGATVARVDSEASTLTDAAGRFRLDRLTPGSANLQIDAAGYETEIVEVLLEAGQVTEVTVTLLGMGSSAPHYEIRSLEGMIGCAFPVRVTTTWFHNTLCRASEGTPLSSVDASVVTFLDVTTNVSAVRAWVFESVWQANQLGGSGLGIDWWTWDGGATAGVAGGPEDPRYLGAYLGRSPLRMVLPEDQIQAVVNEAPPLDNCTPFGHCSITAYALAWPETLGSSSPVDAGFFLQQRFEHYVTSFYGNPAPEGFTALPDQ